jgi:hypothetical protein
MYQNLLHAYPSLGFPLSILVTTAVVQIPYDQFCEVPIRHAPGVGVCMLGPESKTH